MVNIKRLTDQAKDMVEKRGGTDALKEDFAELKEVAKGKGSLSDKAKAAADVLKDPGTRGEQTPPPPDPVTQTDPPPQAHETAGTAPAEGNDRPGGAA